MQSCLNMLCTILGVSICISFKHSLQGVSLLWIGQKQYWPIGRWLLFIASNKLCLSFMFLSLLWLLKTWWSAVEECITRFYCGAVISTWPGVFNPWAQTTQLWLLVLNWQLLSLVLTPQYPYSSRWQKIQLVGLSKLRPLWQSSQIGFSVVFPFLALIAMIFKENNPLCFFPNPARHVCSAKYLWRGAVPGDEWVIHILVRLTGGVGMRIKS